MKKNEIERRKSLRYDTALKVHYKVAYDVKTRVKFQVLDIEKHALTHRKYSGVSKNVSVDGLCFVATKKLEKGDEILLEVYPPNAKMPVHMKGEVKWEHRLPEDSGGRIAFKTGVDILSVEGKPVTGTIHFDRKYKVVWSSVLESLFGNFKTMVESLKKNSSAA
jgi:hypothetical protein